MSMERIILEFDVDNLSLSWMIFLNGIRRFLTGNADNVIIGRYLLSLFYYRDIILVRRTSISSKRISISKINNFLKGCNKNNTESTCRKFDKRNLSSSIFTSSTYSITTGSNTDRNQYIYCNGIL